MGEFCIFKFLCERNMFHCVFCILFQKPQHLAVPGRARAVVNSNSARAESFDMFSLLGGTIDHSHRSSMYEAGSFPLEEGWGAQKVLLSPFGTPKTMGKMKFFFFFSGP